MGTDIPSRFLQRLQKTAGFGTKVVGKAVIRQAFIRKMPASIRAYLATQPDSATLESLAVLADRALASEADESKPGVAEIKVDETTKLVGLLEDLSKRLIYPLNILSHTLPLVVLLIKGVVNCQNTRDNVVPRMQQWPLDIPQ